MQSESINIASMCVGRLVQYPDSIKPVYTTKVWGYYFFNYMKKNYVSLRISMLLLSLFVHI
jgi:hypothetical protein